METTKYELHEVKVKKPQRVNSRKRCTELMTEMKEMKQQGTAA